MCSLQRCYHIYPQEVSSLKYPPPSPNLYQTPPLIFAGVTLVPSTGYLLARNPVGYSVLTRPSSLGQWTTLYPAISQRYSPLHLTTPTVTTPTMASFSRGRGCGQSTSQRPSRVWRFWTNSTKATRQCW